jgi:hypothetical protein
MEQTIPGMEEGLRAAMPRFGAIGSTGDEGQLYSPRPVSCARCEDFDRRRPGAS